MDELDKIIFNSANKVVIESISSFSENPCGNNISVIFAIPQENSILNEPPFNRLKQWMISKTFWGNNCNLRIDNIPNSIDADEIAKWLAKELSSKKYSVNLKRWIAPSKFEKVNF